MRIDTGFLRASIQAALGTLPSGPTRGQKGVSYPNPLPAAGEAVAATLLRWDPMTEVPFFVGWTANYARIREVRDGFLRTATGKWDIIVKTETQKVRSAI